MQAVAAAVIFLLATADFSSNHKNLIEIIPNTSHVTASGYAYIKDQIVHIGKPSVKKKARKFWRGDGQEHTRIQTAIKMGQEDFDDEVKKSHSMYRKIKSKYSFFKKAFNPTKWKRRESTSHRTTAVDKAKQNK